MAPPFFTSFPILNIFLYPSADGHFFWSPIYLLAKEETIQIEAKV